VCVSAGELAPNRSLQWVSHGCPTKSCITCVEYTVSPIGQIVTDHDVCVTVQVSWRTRSHAVGSPWLFPGTPNICCWGTLVNLSHLTEKTKVEWPMSMFLHPNYEKTVVWCQLKFAKTLVTVGLCSEWSKSHLLATAVTLLSLANMSIPKCFKVYLAHSAESVCKDFSASPASHIASLFNSAVSILHTAALKCGCSNLHELA